jgi:hypothetical protein
VHPVQLHVEGVERRSRLTTFFRLILVIPHLVFLYAFGLVAQVVTLIAWFAIVITGRYPQGMWNLVSSYARYSARVYTYMTLVTDPFPPFSAEAPYVSTLELERPERQSRLKALFRLILVFPALIVLWLLSYVVSAVSVLLWWYIVLLGRSPQPLHDFMAGANEYYARFAAYALLLVDAYPGFDRVGEAPEPDASPATA